MRFFLLFRYAHTYTQLFLLTVMGICEQDFLFLHIPISIRDPINYDPRGTGYPSLVGFKQKNKPLKMMGWVRAVTCNSHIMKPLV